MKSFRSIFFVLLLIAGSTLSVAQVYPVQATVQLTPPYSLYLADYVESGTERLVLNVFLADIARPQLDIRFRLKIIGQGVTIETKAEYRPAPVSIQGGVPLRLVSTDLADYFNANNLNFQGMSRREYEQRGMLPEGVYQFCFEVLEYNRGVKVSNTACGTAWMILNDPPIINLPRQNEKLKVQSPQNIILQWTPRHTGSPNSAFTTEYDVTMVEVWPSTRNPNDAILTSPPIFETTTGSTTVVYGPAETPLEPGRRYAFRVRARSIAGVSELDLFKNNGYSEVFTFVYGDACDLPTGIAASSIGTSRFSLGWEGTFNHTAYKVRYREAGTTNWYENNVAVNAADIYSLKPNTTYEYQVAATCGFYDGQYSTVSRITTNPLPEAEYACGAPLGNFALDPNQLTGSLKTGDVIQAGDFDVKLTKVSGSNGIFSGEGVIEVPYLNKAKVKVEFSSIAVNKELRMVNGFMNVTGAAVEVIPQGVMDLMDDLTETLNAVDSALTEVEENLPQQFDPDSFVADTLIDVKEGISSVYKDTDGSVVVVDNKGNEQRIPAGTSAAVKDSDGNGYIVDSKGNVHKTTAEVAAKAGNREFNFALKFTANAGMHYGFDERKHDAIAKDYEQLKQGYSVPWKSVASGGTTDLVTAIVYGTGIDKSKVTFEQSGFALQPQPFTGNQTALSVRGGSDGIEEGLLALYAPTDTGKVQVLGKLNVVSYNKLSNAVVIVPVNKTTLPSGLTPKIIEDSLNAIYSQAIADWKVSVASPIEVDLTGTFDTGETGLLSNYTDDMKKVIKAFGNLQDETYYIFLVENPSDEKILGYMPRGKQAGFVFVDRHGSNKDALVRTIAHELGHGAYSLHHTFKEPNFSLTQGATDNLMDYPSGKRLYKYQWDKMRYPDIVVGLFEEDSEAEARGNTSGILSSWRNPKDKSVNFIAPNGKIVRLPASVTQAYFTFGIGEYTGKNFEMLPAGVLKGFEVTEVKGEKKEKVVTVYLAVWSGGKFLGYKQDGKSDGKAADFYLPKGTVDEGAGTAVMLIHNSKGASVVRYTQLPNDYMIANPATAEAYIDITDKIATHIRANSIINLTEYTYDNKQIQFDISSISPRPEYAGMFDVLYSKEDKLKCNLVVSKIYEYRIVYPDVFDKMTVNFGDWWETNVRIKTVSNDLLNNPGLMDVFLETPKEQITAGYFEYYLRKNDLYLTTSSDRKQEIFIAFLNEFRKMIDYQKMANAKTIASILSDNGCASKNSIYELDPITIRDAIEAMNVEDLQRVCAESRAALVGRILDANVVSNSLEKAIHKMMWTCPADVKSRALFLQALSINTDKTGRYILGKMVESIDDRTLLIGQNFNTIIMNYIIKAYGDYMNYSITNPSDITNEVCVKDIKKLSELSPEVIKGMSKEEIELFQKKIITYNYVGFTKRLFKQALVSVCEMCSLFISDDVKSVVQYNEGDGNITYTNKAVAGFVTVKGVSTPIKLEALQPVMLDDKAKLIDIYSSEGEDGGMFMPAIVLYFVEKKADARTTAEAIGTSADLISLAIPGANATLALKLLNYADKLSSVASLVGTASADDYPQIGKYLQITSAVLGGVNLIGSSAVTKLDDLKNIDDVSKAVNAVDHGQGLLAANKHASEVTKLCNRINAMEPTDMDLMAVLNSGKEDRALLVKTLELEKNAAKAADNSAIVNELENAIRKLSEYKNTAKGITALAKTEKVQVYFARLAEKFKNVRNKFVKADGKYLTKDGIQIAHIDDHGELIMDNLGDLSKLSDEAKFEESLADVSFYTPQSGSNPVVDDILVFDDAGTIKCVSGANCFVAGTEVYTKEGDKFIEAITENDLVWSYNETSKTKAWQRVTNIFKKTTDKIQRIVVGKDTLWTTPEHKFYVQTRGWLKAVALTASMLLQTNDGTAAITENRTIDTVATVYNFTVESSHTYFVGKQLVLTHNDCAKISDFLKGLGDRQSEFLKTFKEHQTLVEKFANGKFDVAAWDAFIGIGGKQDDVVKFFSAVEGWEKSRFSKLLSDLSADSDLKQLLSNSHLNKKLAALDAWSAIRTSGKVDKAEIGKLIDRLLTYGTNSGVINSAKVKEFANAFIDLYGSLTTAAAKNNLAALIEVNSRVEVFTKIKGWPKEIREEFFTGLMSRPGTVTTSNFLADRLKDIDPEILDYYKRFTEMKLLPNKKYDFDFLAGCKGKSDDELIELLATDTRKLKADAMRADYPKVAALLEVSNYKSNLLKSITDIFESGGQSLDNYIELYRKDPVTYNALIGLKGKSNTEIKKGLETLFNGTDFNAHHIIPVNMLYNSEVCKEIMEWALKQTPPKELKFHDIDNLIFLRDANHTGGTFGHNKYDDLIKKEIDLLENAFDDNPAVAYNRLLEIISKYRNKIQNELVGSVPPKKLDELK